MGDNLRNHKGIIKRMFEYTLKDDNSIKCIIAKGRIDALSSPEIQQIFDELILAGERIFIVDMASVNYVSSAGLRIFISTQKELKKVQGEIILSAITEQVFEIFRMSGLTKIFRIITNIGEMPERLRTNQTEREIITRDIGDISIEYIEEKAKKGVLFAIGSQGKLGNSAYTKEDVIAVKPTEMQFGCGLAALGHSYDEFKDLFGESMVVKNNFFFYPAVKHPSVDFVINAHKDPGITYKLLHGFGFNGDYRYILSFQSRNGAIELSSLIKDFFTISDANIIGFSFLAKSKGLWGCTSSGYQLSNKNRNGMSIFLDFFANRVAELEMQLETRLDTIIGSLSGGQRQAISLLMAVIREPEVLLLDEHTAALDPKSAAQIIKLTKTFIERGNLTTLMVTHSMQQALELGTRTVMMHQGKIIDDIPEKEKRQLTVNDLLDKFAELRKSEKLTDEMTEQLRREYL